MGVVDHFSSIFICFSFAVFFWMLCGACVEEFKNGFRIVSPIKIICSSLVMAVLGPWAYYLLVESCVDDVVAGRSKTSISLAQVLASFAPVYLISVLSPNESLLMYATVVMFLALIFLFCLLKKNGL
jgi:hypothetical protein